MRKPGHPNHAPLREAGLVKHDDPRIGAFDPDEKLLHACWFDRQDQVESWVRKLVRKNDASFSYGRPAMG